jgi:drug/metabolite transporter (DMT)-like permease
VSPLLGGLAAALAWAGATLCAASSSRRIGSTSTLAWVMLSGFLLSAPLAAATGWPEGLDGPAAGWLALAGAGNVAGLGLIYAALRRAGVGVVAGIVSTEGALAALIAIAAGERPAPVTTIGFLPLLIGVVLVATGPRLGPQAPAEGRRAGIMLAALAAAAFAVNLFATGQASESVPIAWVALPARLIGVVILVGALAVGLRPLVSPRIGRIAIAAGVLEVAGMLSFGWGAREGIAVTSVMASQFAALAALGAFLLFGESLVRRQLVGVAALAVGVAMVALGGA